MSRATPVEEISAHDADERRQSSANERGLERMQECGIPEDDGMRTLREKLHEIRLLAISTDERARRMHELMTKDYLTHLATNDGLKSRMQSISLSDPPTDEASHDNPYHLQHGDLELSFSPLPTTTDHDHDDETVEEEDEGLVLGCIHYKRNVKIQCFDCKRWYPCRHCHDAARDLPFQHNLNRKKTENMLCMLCKTPQPAGEVCCNCGQYAAWYYCSKCKLWDNDSNKRIYHCDDCGLCRIGEGLGKDFVHCRRCNVCISIGASAAHPCIERATDSDCPLCLTYLFESQTPVISLPCGHYMHGECYKDLMAVTYKCPVCNKSAVNMETQWRKMDDEIAAQPMPEDDQDLANLLPHVDEQTANTEDTSTRPRRPRVVWIGCNDCGGRCHTPFHWLGLKCQVCGGYNTNQMAPPAGRETETERVLRQQAQHRQHDFTGNFVLRDGGVGVVTEDDVDCIDSAYARSSSPSSSPAQPSAQRAHSPRGRYFVQPELPRRSSFTAPRFTTPRFTAPSMPNLPALPRMPDLPSLQDMALPSLPQMQMPNIPHGFAMPSIELPRFLPYDMVSVISRSLSPMRYYREGVERRASFRRSMSGTTWRNSGSASSWESDADASGQRCAKRTSSGSEDGSVGTEDTEHVILEEEDIFDGLIGHR
ncbi:hypothetical protein AMS68_003777 [Peltaster fructicola]|uniref:RING-type domain-containing protein n=1 Tax=Peltaster fructicola TaxID=286661 RepID=A0A6H0XUY6_9PEZI|nr:hypothetical protein AMS68_003777 [Peltaster fructicola]